MSEKQKTRRARLACSHNRTFIAHIEPAILPRRFTTAIFADKRMFVSFIAFVGKLKEVCRFVYHAHDKLLELSMSLWRYVTTFFSKVLVNGIPTFCHGFAYPVAHNNKR
jgi:hypothetical protein